MIDFEEINRSAIPALPGILPSFLPGGKLQGREYVCSDLSGGQGGSLSVNTDTGKWADFGTGEKGGDPVSLFAAIWGVKQSEAARRLAEIMGTVTEAPKRHTTARTTTETTWTSTPAVKLPAIRHPQHGIPDATWEYLDKKGGLLGYACRYDQPDGKKDIIPYTHGIDEKGVTSWRWKSFPEPRPIYGLNKLSERLDAPVLIVEGEKTADAAGRLLPGAVCTTWPGGSNAVGKADYSPLKGRRIAIWPDNDDPGRKAAEAIAQQALRVGALEIFMIDPPLDKVAGWDLADAELEGWTPGQVGKWIAEHKRQIAIPQAQAAIGAEVWPEPLPLVSRHASEHYPLDALPGIIGAAVREVVGFVQCPLALAACSALAVVSTVAQGLVDVRRADGLEGPASLFFLALADSGERKTTVDSHFSGSIKQWERDQSTLAKPDLVKFEAEKGAWEAKKSGLLTAIQTASKSGKDTSELEMQMIDLERNKPELPKVPRLLFSDSTPEALAFSLADKWPVGAVIASEAGVVFGGHAMGKESVMRNLSLLNTLWDGQPLRIDRKSGASYTVDGARLTMGLAVQPETVKAFLDASKGLARGIGFLARFMIAWPESTQGDRMFKNPPSCWPDRERFHRQLNTLLSRPLDFDENGRLNPQMLELSTDAKKIWIAFHDDVETELRPGRDMAEARDVASKAADNAARLAALFHVFENSPGGSIGSDHMETAARIVSWHLYEARRFIGEIALPVEQTNALKLDAWLIEYCRREKTMEVSTRHLQQNGPYATRKKDDLDQALEELKEAGRIRSAKDGQKKLVKINPALLEG